MSSIFKDSDTNIALGFEPSLFYYLFKHLSRKGQNLQAKSNLSNTIHLNNYAINHNEPLMTSMKFSLFSFPYIQKKEKSNLICVFFNIAKSVSSL